MRCTSTTPAKPVCEAKGLPAILAFWVNAPGCDQCALILSFRLSPAKPPRWCIPGRGVAQLCYVGYTIQNACDVIKTLTFDPSRATPRRYNMSLGTTANFFIRTSEQGGPINGFLTKQFKARRIGKLPLRPSTGKHLHLVIPEWKSKKNQTPESF